MSDMSAAVILRLVDELSGPAKKAATSVKSLVKDLEKLKGLSGARGLGGIKKQMEGMSRQMREVQKTARGLRETLGRPVPDGFKRAVSGIERVRNEATRATRAVSELESRLRRGGSFNGRGGGGGGGGHGRGGANRGGGHGGGFAGHIRSEIGREIIRHAVGTGLGMAFYAMGGKVVEWAAESVHAGMEQSFEKAHTVAMLRMQGEKMGDINAAVSQAGRMTRLTPQFTSAQNLEAIAELRPALLGGLKEATQLAPMFQSVVGVLEAAKQGNGSKALGGVDTHGEALELVRALEVKGVTQKGDGAMHSYADNITKAIVAFNGQLGAKDFHAAFKFSKFAATGWTEDFSTQILPTIMNEMKASMHASASSTGVALKSMYQAVVSNKMTGPALDAWYDLGMYGRGDLNFDKKGKAKSAKTGAHMKGFETFMEDPYKFVQDVLLPQMKASGLDISNAKLVTAKMGELFGNRNAEFIASLLAIQKNLLEKDRDNVKKAMGMDGLKFLQESDPTTRMQVLAAAFKELGGAIGDLALPGNMRGMKGLIDWAHGMSDAVKGSTYGKKLSGYYESAIAGMFGQRLGRKGLNGRNGEYFMAGRELGQGWSKFAASIGKLAQLAEEAGAVTASMRAFGDAFGGMSHEIDADTKLFTRALNSDFAKQVRADFDNYGKVFNEATTALSSHFGQAMDAFPNELRAAGQGIVDALSGVASWIKSKLAWTGMFPEEKKNGGASASYDIDPTPAAMRGKPSWAGGLGTGFNAKAFDPTSIVAAATAAVPSFSMAGASAMTALAGGISSGEGAATGAMTSLMASLASIASAGVTVPVKLDTSGAEAKLSALMAKANSVGSGGTGKDGRFSKALSDTGQ